MPRSTSIMHDRDFGAILDAHHRDPRNRGMRLLLSDFIEENARRFGHSEGELGGVVDALRDPASAHAVTAMSFARGKIGATRIDRPDPAAAKNLFAAHNADPGNRAIRTLLADYLERFWGSPESYVRRDDLEAKRQSAIAGLREGDSSLVFPAVHSKQYPFLRPGVGGHAGRRELFSFDPDAPVSDLDDEIDRWLGFHHAGEYHASVGNHEIANGMHAAASHARAGGAGVGGSLATLRAAGGRVPTHTLERLDDDVYRQVFHDGSSLLRRPWRGRGVIPPPKPDGVPPDGVLDIDPLPIPGFDAAENRDRVARVAASAWGTDW